MATKERGTAILDVRPMLRGSEKAVVEAVLGRRPGVERVEAHPVAQTATVTYNPAETSLADLRRWVQECGLHCAGQSVPNHICDPLMEPDLAEQLTRAVGWRRWPRCRSGGSLSVPHARAVLPACSRLAALRAVVSSARSRSKISS